MHLSSEMKESKVHFQDFFPQVKQMSPAKLFQLKQLPALPTFNSAYGEASERLMDCFVKWGSRFAEVKALLFPVTA